MARPGEDPASAFPSNVAVPALRDDGMLGVLLFGSKPEQINLGTE